MRFPSRVLTMIASILLVLMMIGCDPPAGSTDASSPPGTVATFEQALVDADTSEPIGEPTSESSAPGDSVFGASADGGFGGVGEIDDPFAVIGPVFSGLGLQTYSSSCDPFEDTYGTCL